MKDLAYRLLARREVVGTCWVFRGSLDRYGYGRLFVDGSNVTAHRAAWAAFRGDPGTAHVLHNEDCTSRACFNPAHLHVGTHQRNMRERDDWGSGIRGHRVATAKLTSSDVAEIRDLREAGALCKTLAERYGVSPSTISHAALGRTWAPVPHTNT